MTDRPDTPDFDLDLALSAQLDGELGTYAAELGLSEAELAARLATGTAQARGTELAAAAAALGAPVPPIDELTARRMVGTALAAGAGAGQPGTPRDVGAARRPVARPTMGARIAAVAAAVALVVGIGVVARQAFSDGDSATSADRGDLAATAAPVPTGDLGDLGILDPSRIDGFVTGRGTAAPTPETAAGAQDSQGEAGANESTGAGASRTLGPAAQKRLAAAASRCADVYAAEGPVRFTATGTFRGSPVVVVGIETDNRTVVFVVAEDDCADIVYSASR